MSAPFIPGSGGRDHRLDVFRGLALITIFINHVPGNIYEKFTSRNLGFSDAAEGFVLMSGIAVGLAYSRGFANGDPAAALKRVWRRAGTLYLAHIITSVFAIAILAFGIMYLDTAEVVRRVNFTRFLDQPLAALIGLPTLTHQLGYFNILPLYFALLVASPLYIMIGLRNRWAMIAFAGLVWAAAGTFRLNLPNFPNSGGWFFNPLAWQFIYAVGIAGGLSMMQGRKLVPFSRPLLAAAAAFLVFAVLWMRLRMGGLPGGRQLPFFISSFDKTFLSLPRFLHALALAYVLTNLAVVGRLLASRPFGPVALMGQNALGVFATGSILAIALQVFRARFDTTMLEDGALLFAGLAIQYAVARFLSAQSARKRALRNVVPVPVAAPDKRPEAAKPRETPSVAA